MGNPYSRHIFVRKDNQLQCLVLVGQVLGHIEKECSHLVKIHIEVLADTHPVFEYCHIIPLQSLERAVEI